MFRGSNSSWCNIRNRIKMLLMELRLCGWQKRRWSPLLRLLVKLPLLGSKLGLDKALTAKSLSWIIANKGLLDYEKYLLMLDHALGVNKCMDVARRQLVFEFSSEGRHEDVLQHSGVLIESYKADKKVFEAHFFSLYKMNDYEGAVRVFPIYLKFFYPSFKALSLYYAASVFCGSGRDASLAREMMGKFPAALLNEKSLKFGARIFYTLADKGFIAQAYEFKDSVAHSFSRLRVRNGNPYLTYQVLMANFYLGNFDEVLETENELREEGYDWGVNNILFFELNMYCRLARLVRSSEDVATGIEWNREDIKINLRVEDEASFIYYKRLIKGKSVAIVGPADTGQDIGEEVDLYDVVIRTNVFSFNDYKLDSDRLGKKVDVSYYTKATAAIRKEDLIRFSRESDCTIVFRNDSSMDEFGRDKVKFPARIVSNSLCNFMPNYQKMHAIQRILWDVLKYEPSEIKVFNVNFYVGGMYHDKYKPQGKVPDMKSLGLVHDPVQSFMFSKSLFELGVVEFDDVAGNVLKMSREEYIRYLQENYGTAWLENEGLLGSWLKAKREKESLSGAGSAVPENCQHASESLWQ